MCHPTEFGHSRSNGTSVTKEDLPENLTYRVPPFKVMQGHRNDTHRSANYDFLYSNHEPISYRFRDKQRFQSTKNSAIADKPRDAFRDINLRKIP